MKKPVDWFSSRDRIQNIAAIAAIVVFYLLLHFLGIGCPIKFITGIPCAGCGMTRAWLSVVHFHLAEAFKFHPLFWTIPFGMLCVFFRRYLSKEAIRFLLIFFAVLFMIVYFIRMMNPEDTIVKINFKESVIGYILEKAGEIIW